MEPFTILAALLPVLTEAGKAAASRWLAPDQFKPTNVQDWLAMRKADLDMFTAINGAGGTGNTYAWVEAVKQLMRPVVACIVLCVWGYAHGFMPSIDPEALKSIDNFAGAIGFYLFGDRTLFYVAQRGQNVPGK